MPGEASSQSRPRSFGDALDTLIGIYIEHSLNYLSKEMWRHAMAISTQQPDSPFGHTYSALDRALAGQICELIEGMQTSVWWRWNRRPIARGTDLQQHEYDVHRVREARRGYDHGIAARDIRRQNCILVCALERSK